MNYNDFQIYPTRHSGVDLPEWQDDVHGTSAVVMAVQDIINGVTNEAKFIVCKHPKVDSGEVFNVVAVHKEIIEGKHCLQWHDGGSVIATWYPFAWDAAFLSAKIVQRLLSPKSGLIFRVQPR